MAGGGSRWLLIGNSRWHWAEDRQGERHYWSEPPAPALPLQPRGWAAVGPVPQGVPPAGRLALAHIPLQNLPPWLGIDRALGGYEAWQRCHQPVLVADAGTALSLTWVDAEGRFCGGRLQAGAALQLQALHQGTAQLPVVHQAALGSTHQVCSWPDATEAAMVAGVLEGLAGALQRAAAQLLQRQPNLKLWLTGGDAGALHSLLAASGGQAMGWQLAPGLCLDGLARAAAAFSSAPGQPGCHRPSSRL